MPSSDDKMLLVLEVLEPGGYVATKLCDTIKIHGGIGLVTVHSRHSLPHACW